MNFLLQVFLFNLLLEGWRGRGEKEKNNDLLYQLFMHIGCFSLLICALPELEPTTFTYQDDTLTK